LLESCPLESLEQLCDADLREHSHLITDERFSSLQGFTVPPPSIDFGLSAISMAVDLQETPDFLTAIAQCIEVSPKRLTDFLSTFLRSHSADLLQIFSEYDAEEIQTHIGSLEEDQSSACAEHDLNLFGLVNLLRRSIYLVVREESDGGQAEGGEVMETIYEHCLEVKEDSSEPIVLLRSSSHHHHRCYQTLRYGQSSIAVGKVQLTIDQLKMTGRVVSKRYPCLSPQG
jgi:hypothetical protein